MKSILTFLLIFLFISCEESKIITTDNIDGFWETTQSVTFENGEPKDTINGIPYGPRTYEGVEHYFFNEGKYVLLRNPIILDSLGKDRARGIFAVGNFRTSSDTIFTAPEYGRDGIKETPYYKRANGVFKTKFILNGDNLLRYRINKQGKGIGAIYKRIDVFDAEDPANGFWRRTKGIVQRNFKATDTIPFSSRTFSELFMMRVLSKKFSLNMINHTYLDDNGNDVATPQYFLFNYERLNDTIVESYESGHDASFDGELTPLLPNSSRKGWKNSPGVYQLNGKFYKKRKTAVDEKGNLILSPWNVNENGDAIIPLLEKVNGRIK
tara:strand:+ start:733 stop:1704 length:972 start_codon:yes stop_codon:yes gene_type:complete